MAGEQKTEVVTMKSDDLSKLIAEQTALAAKEAATAALAEDRKARAEAEKAAAETAAKAEQAKRDAEEAAKLRKEELQKEFRDFLKSEDIPDRVVVSGAEDKTPKSGDRRVIFAQVKSWRDKYTKETLDFCDALRRGPVAFAMFQEKHRAAVLTTGSDASGGEYLLTEEMAAMVERTLWQNVEWANAVDIMPTSKANGKWPIISDLTVDSVAEGAAMTESSPTFTRTQWNAWKIGRYAKVSLETLEDSEFDVAALIAERFAKAIAEEVDEKLLIGNNSAMPYGVYYCVTGLGATSYAVGGTITYRALVALEHTLKKEYRKNAVFLGDDAIMKYIQRLVDSNNRPIFERAMEAGQPPKVLGYPFLTSTRSTLPTTHLLFGDPNYYKVMWRNGMTVESSKEQAWTEDEVWIKTRVRLDGILSDAANSFVYGTGITG